MHTCCTCNVLMFSIFYAAADQALAIWKEHVDYAWSQPHCINRLILLSHVHASALPRSTIMDQYQYA